MRTKCQFQKAETEVKVTLRHLVGEITDIIQTKLCTYIQFDCTC